MTTIGSFSSTSMARPRCAPQQSMHAFTTISKPVTILAEATKKRKHDDDEADIPVLSLTTTTKKRRVVIITPPHTPTKIRQQKAFAQIDVSKSLSNLKRKRYTSPEVELAGISPSESTTELDDLPIELDDMKRLNAAFLSSLSIHFAHNASTTSADLRMILPTITKLWAKRKATVEDVRRLVGITHLTSTKKSQNVTRFALKSYGEGKVCVELAQRGRAGTGFSAALNEAHTTALFDANLEHAWQSWTDLSQGVTAFIASLPLEPLQVAESTAKIAPMRAAKQRRLEEVLTPFKNFNIADSPRSPDRSAKRTRRDNNTPSFNLLLRELPSANAQPEPLPLAAPKDRSLSLLERIQKKEAIAALAPAAPSKDERQRRAALQRAEEILEILNLLAVAKGGSSRSSFPLRSLQASIQSSIRSPMSTDEVSRCLNVLTTDIAPGHISMVTFGSVTGVVVDRSRKPQLSDVKARLRERGV